MEKADDVNMGEAQPPNAAAEETVSETRERMSPDADLEVDAVTDMGNVVHHKRKEKDGDKAVCMKTVSSIL